MNQIRMKKIISLAFAAFLLLASLAGCAASGPEGSPQSQTEPPSAESTTQEITDMAGRSHIIPAQLNTVYTTDPVSMIALYTLAPDLMAGLNYALTEQESRYFLAETAALPVLGMRDSLNAEAVLQAGAQTVIAMGKLDESAQEEADALQEKLSVPVVMVDGSFTALPEAYRFLGSLLQREERAEELAVYAETLFEKTSQVAVAPEDQVTFYYGNGVDSLETVLAGSSNNLEFELAGGVNSANIEIDALKSGRAQISAEQLISFMPQVIFLNGDPKRDLAAAGAVGDFLSNSAYATLPAVQEGRVYAIPTAPFAWVERPQSANRLIGLLWTAQMLYPEYYGYDLEAEIISFYSLFYHVELSPEEAAALLAG